MAERMVLGVDFSGARGDDDVGKTWVTRASLDMGDDSLILWSCKPISRKKLTALLMGLSNDAVVALDFPFSLPMAFAERLGCAEREMPALWQSVAPMELDEFKAKAAGFTELLRVGDLHCANAKPCLKMVGNPVMINMTFRGMQMLHHLRQAGCRVPPLDDNECDGATLLEVMPGAALKVFGLPDGYKGGQAAFENRRKILKELPKRSNVTLLNLHDFRDECMFSDDALDSIVAAVVAAMCALDRDETQIKRPSNDKISEYNGKRSISLGIVGKTEIEVAKLEGWIYVPYPRK